MMIALKKPAVIAASALLFACGGGGGSGGAVAQQSQIVQQFDSLSCLTGERLQAVRANPSAGTADAFAACLPEFSTKTGRLQLTDSQARVAFASVLAHSLAPYGKSISISLDDLLMEDALDCDNYAILTGRLAGFLEPNASLRFVGFDGGSVGNHAQVFSEDGLMLDPTIGLIAKTSFDDLLMGKPSDSLIVFKQRVDPAIEGFDKRVITAITTGSYRPSDLLYYFHGIAHYLYASDGMETLGNSELDALVKKFPTPGARPLQEGLVSSR